MRKNKRLPALFLILVMFISIMPTKVFAASDVNGQAIVDYAKTLQGIPYVWGGTTTSGFDCSGFVQYVYAHFGVNLSRTTYTQVNEGVKVYRDQLQLGDLVFFGSDSNVHHVGIYVGNGQFIHAPQTGDVVKISSLSGMSDYYTARRIVEYKEAPVKPVNPYDEIDRVIFDANFYADKYPDLKNSFGYDYNKLYDHWQNVGKKEGRVPSAVFDPHYYLDNNSDVKSACNNNLETAYQHFVTQGYKDNRKSSPVFDMGFYKSLYPDLNGLGSNLNVLRHFISNGMKEGRQASNNFNPRAYAERYSDLNKLYGDNYISYFNHYLIAGMYEGRSGENIIPTNTNPYEEIDRIIFDANFYANKYPDLKNAFGNDYNKLYDHWQKLGKKEGRAPSALFDPQYYLDNNSDVKSACNNNLETAYQHFVTQGYKDNRKFSPVFDMEFYKRMYPDLSGLGSNLNIIRHFMVNGMKEGRQASSNFNPIAYAGRYSDLSALYGNNYMSYFYHYLINGINEGRIGN